MDAVSLSPFRVGSLLWQPRANAWRLTVVCKATVQILPGESRLAETQEDLNEDDNHWNDDVERSLYSPTDLAPFKMRADVLVVGHAFAPRGESVRSLLVRVIVAELDKTIEVFGNRGFSSEGVLEEPVPFSRMPLRYERAAGGPETMNPVGISHDAPPDANGVVPVANMQPPGAQLHRRGTFIEPVGFGPISPSWPLRSAQLGRHAANWPRTSWNRAPLPDDIELGYFNSAPRDQQIESIRDNERFVLENLHPDQTQLVSRLPGSHPRAFVERPGRVPEDLPMRADTLWIDTDRAVCTLTWRGQVVLENPNESGRVLVAMEEPRQRLTWPDFERLVELRSQPRKRAHTQVSGEVPPRHDEGARRMPSDLAPRPNPISAVPPAGHAAPVSQPDMSDRVSPKTQLGLGPGARFQVTAPPALAPGGGSFTARPARPPNQPVQQAAPVPATGAEAPAPAPALAMPTPKPLSEAPPALAGRPPRVVEELSFPTMDLTAARMPNPLALASALPFSAPQTPVFTPPVAPQPVVRHRVSLDEATSTEEPVGMPNSMPSWLIQQSPPPSSSAPAQVPSAGADPLRPSYRPAPDAAPRTPRPSDLPPRPSSVPPAAAAPPGAPGFEEVPSSSKLRGQEVSSPPRPAVPASNPHTPRAPSPSHTVIEHELPRRGRVARPNLVELLFVDAEAPARVRDAASWRDILDQLSPAIPRFGYDEPRADLDHGKQGQREVYAVLTRGTPVEANGLLEALAHGTADDGTFEPPVLLMGGEIEVAFDEVEALRATVAAVVPILPRATEAGTREQADRPLREAVETARAWLQDEVCKGASSVADALTSRILDTWGRAGRMVPTSYLDAHTDRILLERRAYRSRTVLNGQWIQALLSVPRGSAPTVTYLPVAAAARLPLFRRFRVRALVEVHPPQEPADGQSLCVRVLALARQIPGTTRSRQE